MIDDKQAGHLLAKEYEELVEKIERCFIEIYYPDWEYEDCYSIGKGSKRKTSPSGPLDIGEGTYYWTINDMWTALYHKIPVNVVLEWYNKYQDHTNKETYGSVNLYSYWRSNYDKAQYDKEKQQDIEENEQRMIETSYLLDEAMGAERGTSYSLIKSQIDSAVNKI